jgi:hypothetical protein
MTQELAEAYEPFAGAHAPQSSFRLAHHAEPRPCVCVCVCVTVVEADETASRSYALAKVPKKLQSDFDEMRLCRALISPSHLRSHLLCTRRVTHMISEFTIG